MPDIFWSNLQFLKYWLMFSTSSLWVLNPVTPAVSASISTHWAALKTPWNEGWVEKSDSRSGIRPDHRVWTDLAVVAVVFCALPWRMDDFPRWDKLDRQLHHRSPFLVFSSLKVILFCFVLATIPLPLWRECEEKYYTSLLRFVDKSLHQSERDHPKRSLKTKKLSRYLALIRNTWKQIRNYKSECRDLELGCYLLQSGESQWGQLPLTAARGCCLSGSGIMGRIWSSAWLKMGVTCRGYVSFVLIKCVCVCAHMGVVNTLIFWMKILYHAVVSMYHSWWFDFKPFFLFLPLNTDEVSGLSQWFPNFFSLIWIIRLVYTTYSIHDTA